CGDRRSQREADKCPHPSDITPVVGSRHMATPDVDVFLDPVCHPPAHAVDALAGCVVNRAADNSHVMSRLRPQPRELVESRSAGFARREVVLMDDEDLHEISWIESNEPPDRSNDTPIDGVSMNQACSTTSNSTDPPDSTVTIVIGAADRSDTAKEGA